MESNHYSLGIWGSDRPFHTSPTVQAMSQIMWIEKLQPDFYCHVLRTLEDYKTFSALLKQKLEIWPILLPWSEGLSIPHTHHWSKWADLFHRLQIKQAIIDDMNVHHNLGLMDWERLESLSSAVELYPVVYAEKNAFLTNNFHRFLSITDKPNFAGWIVPWTKICSSTGYENMLRHVKSKCDNIIPLIYMSSTSWHVYPPPEPKIVKELLSIAQRFSKRIIAYCPPSRGPLSELLRERKRIKE